MYFLLLKLIAGQYPANKEDDKISPKVCLMITISVFSHAFLFFTQLCQYANESHSRYFWLTTTDEDEENFHPSAQRPSALHPELRAPFKTEMAYWVEGETAGCEVFIVGFFLYRVNFSHPKLKFITGLGYAIYVAAFELDEDVEIVPENELDVKMHSLVLGGNHHVMSTVEQTTATAGKLFIIDK